MDLGLDNKMNPKTKCGRYDAKGQAIYHNATEISIKCAGGCFKTFENV